MTPPAEFRPMTGIIARWGIRARWRQCRVVSWCYSVRDAETVRWPWLAAARGASRPLFVWLVAVTLGHYPTQPPTRSEFRAMPAVANLSVLLSQKTARPLTH